MARAPKARTPIICPTCHDRSKPVARGSDYFPFCCRECRDRDLTSWVDERFRVDSGPAHPLDAEAEENL